MVGKHLILDIYAITDNEKIRTCEALEPLFEEIVKGFKLDVLEKSKHNFKPFGATMIYLLSESHISAHTFFEEYQISFDIFTCGKLINCEKPVDIVYQIFEKNCIIDHKILDR